VAWLAQRGRWLSYSVGMVITEAVHQHVLKIPSSAWTPAVETSGEVRDGAWVAELTRDLVDGWAKGMRLIVRKIEARALRLIQQAGEVVGGAGK
jgi:hypothetical protein